VEWYSDSEAASTLAGLLAFEEKGDLDCHVMSSFRFTVDVEVRCDGCDVDGEASCRVVVGPLQGEVVEDEVGGE
jgi:hypothetical protein